MRDRAKYGDAADVDDLAQVLEQTIGDLFARAFRGLPSLGRVALMEQIGRASRGRCVTRWQTPGLPRADAVRLADDPAIGAGPVDVLPSASRPVVLLCGDLGSGKSLCADRYLQAAVERLLGDGGAPIPVWLASKQAQNGLTAAVTAACSGLGEPRLQGATIVVDGLDQVGAELGESLLAEARELTVTWPTTTVLLTSRPLVSLSRAEELREMPLLEDDQVWEIAIRGAGHDLPMAMRYGLPQPVWASMRRPLLALLYGVWQRERAAGQPRSQGDLLAFLGDQAERRAGHEMRDLLMDLSVASVRRELGAVPAADIGAPDQVRRLIDSGIVSERPGGIVPGLPVLAQWFAGQALLEARVTIDSLLAEPDDIDLWRYPLALAVATASFDQAAALLDPLMRGVPGFAFVVINEALARASLEGTPAPPWREAGDQMRAALQTIADGVAPLGDEVLPLDDDGHLLPLGVVTGGQHVDHSFYYGEPHREPVFQLSASDLAPGNVAFRRWSGTAVGRGAAWAWRWARDELRRDLIAAIKYRTFPLDASEPWMSEQTWASAAALMGLPISSTSRPSGSASPS